MCKHINIQNMQINGCIAIARCQCLTQRHQLMHCWQWRQFVVIIIDSRIQTRIHVQIHIHVHIHTRIRIKVWSVRRLTAVGRHRGGTISVSHVIEWRKSGKHITCATIVSHIAIVIEYVLIVAAIKHIHIHSCNTQCELINRSVMQFNKPVLMLSTRILFCFGGDAQPFFGKNTMPLSV